MNGIARKLSFSLQRLGSALIIIYLFAAPFASVHASDAVTEIYQEGKKAAARKLTGKIVDKGNKGDTYRCQCVVEGYQCGRYHDMDGNLI